MLPKQVRVNPKINARRLPLSKRLTILYFRIARCMVVFAAPLLLLYLCSSQREIIISDLKRWLKIYRSHSRTIYGLLDILWNFPEYRNLFYYRIERPNPWWRVVTAFMRIIYHPCPTLFIWCRNIGPGLFIQHGWATAIDARRIGSNCWINQNVTIGFRGRGIPIIGDNVRVHVGAAVLGEISIGSNSIIGASSLVLKDVPSNSVAVGVPAYIMKQDGIRIR